MSQPTKTPPTNSAPLRRNYDALVGEIDEPRTGTSIHRPGVATVMIGLGVVMGLVALPLVTNAYGNTFSLGLKLAALSGSFIAMGACSLRRRWAVVLGIGVIALPLGPMLVAFFYWSLYLLGVY